VGHSYFVELIDQRDDGWFEVAYEDGDVAVRGFMSRRDPPARLHRGAKSEPLASALAPNATIADHTCLHAAPGGEPIGFVVGDQPARLDRDERTGWFRVGLDTPWGVIELAARGVIASELAKCGGT
jgi:hypothetical protein